MLINLTDTDFDHCVQLTKTHLATCKQRGAKQAYNHPENLDFEHVLQGYLGEQAVANYFKYETVYKPYNKSEYDILGYEVRTVYYSKAILITHPEDKPGNYILVSINKNEMVATLKGWSDLERCNLWQLNWKYKWREPCFGMDELQLWPMDMLPATPELIAHQMRLAA